MKNIKKVALTALAALATTAPAANAQFTDEHGNVFYTPDDFGVGPHAVIAEQLYEIGVPIVDGRGTNLCANENVMGWYTGEHNFMVICYGSTVDRLETLTHEAVHVVQDCRAGLENNNLDELQADEWKRVAAALPQSKVDLIVNAYDKEDWGVEAEAFYFETKPGSVRNALSNTCGASWSF